MRAFRFALPLVAAAALAALLDRPCTAAAQTAIPSQLLGAWGSDGSCTADVVIFRTDGSIVDPGAAPGSPPTTYGVNGGTITFTQGQKTGQFALAVADQAVAWSNGAAIVLKERCADQSAFTSRLGPQPPPVSLYDKIRALAAEPLQFNGIAIKVVGVEGHTALAPATQGVLYSEVIAHPDPNTVGDDATLLYRIFPTPEAAAAHVSLAVDMRSSFVYERRGAGFFSTASATDEAPTGRSAKPVTVDCLRFHPKGQDRVTIGCFAHLPGSRLVAGGAQTFPLAHGSKGNDMGSKDDLSEALDLTSLAIDKLRGFLAAQPSP
jgi:hypothetical protein